MKLLRGGLSGRMGHPWKTLPLHTTVSFKLCGLGSSCKPAVIEPGKGFTHEVPLSSLIVCGSSSLFMVTRVHTLLVSQGSPTTVMPLLSPLKELNAKPEN